MKKILLVFVILLSYSAKAEIIETNDLVEVRDKFVALQEQYNPAKILGVFALDNVILKASDPSLMAGSDYGVVIKKSISRVRATNLAYLNEVLITNYQHELTDTRLPAIINQIKSGGSQVIAISNTVTGNFNKIPRLEVWISDYIGKFGIDLRNNNAENEDLPIQDLDTPELSVRAVLYRGLLSIGEHTKDNTKLYALGNLFMTTKFVPEIVVMVDSDLYALRGVEAQLQELYPGKSQFIGYHYHPSGRPDNSELDGKIVAKFWTGMADLLNRVKRTTKSDNPYEQ